MEMIVLLKFKVDEDQLKDQTDETINGMHMLLQKFAKNAVDCAIQEDGGTTLFKVVESACAKMMPGAAKKGLDGPPKMTGGEGK